MSDALRALATTWRPNNLFGRQLRKMLDSWVRATWRGSWMVPTALPAVATARKSRNRHYVYEAPNGAPEKALLEALKFSGDDCLIWPFQRDQNGYARIFWGGHKRPVCNVVCEITFGPKPTAEHESAHSCGNGHLGCINPTHLRWATHRENMSDMVEHGSSNRGRKNPRAKLTEKDVVVIRQLAGSSTQRAIARRYNVDPSTISNIVRRRYWSVV